MKTAHYTFTTWNESAMASGFGGGAPVRQAALVREPRRKARTLGGDNVIDLTAWRAAKELEPEEEPLDEADWAGAAYGESEEPELYIPAPRPRKSRRAAFLAELTATVGVAAAALAVILLVVAF